MGAIISYYYDPSHIYLATKKEYRFIEVCVILLLSYLYVNKFYKPDTMFGDTNTINKIDDSKNGFTKTLEFDCIFHAEEEKEFKIE